MQALNSEALSEEVVTRAFQVLAIRRLDILEAVSNQDPVREYYRAAINLIGKLRELLPGPAKSLADHLSQTQGKLIDQVFFASFFIGFVEAYLALQVDAQESTKH